MGLPIALTQRKDHGRFVLSATCSVDGREYDFSQPQLVVASLTVETTEQAAEIAAMFPKSVKVYGTSLGTMRNGRDYNDGSITLGYVQLRIDLTPNGVKGAINETGLKRYRSFLKNAAKLGFEVVYNSEYAGNSYETLDAFEEATAA